ncbi:MAG: YkgJ family cysteine cluster protein [Chitinophagaceae bacterium]|nr:YkgJ family cysteine cluster protein [Chitinophagaceae bacterium]
MLPVNFRSFKQRVRHNHKSFKKFLTKIEKNPPRGLDKIADDLNTHAWQNVDCLSCANCCKTMSPTFTRKDILRISKHVGMTAKGFTEKYLEYDKKDNDWINKSRPCQFLNLQTNMCSIYDVRPADCAGFPHLNKKKMVDYIHVHKQNVEYCPATYLMVEQMMQRIDLGPQLPAVKIKRITLQK